MPVVFFIDRGRVSRTDVLFHKCSCSTFGFGPRMHDVWRGARRVVRRLRRRSWKRTRGPLQARRKMAGSNMLVGHGRWPGVEGAEVRIRILVSIRFVHVQAVHGDASFSLVEGCGRNLSF
ncbi:unnamed protein product [Hapterophycus canaliculatus]